MMSRKGLQVLDSNGVALKINKVDAEICALFNNPVDAKMYCGMGNEKEYIEDYLKNHEGSSKAAAMYMFITDCPNWFDTIGWLASNEGKSLDEIVEYYTSVMRDFIGKKDNTGEIITIETVYPGHMKVINYFKEKNYTLIGVDLY